MNKIIVKTEVKYHGHNCRNITSQKLNSQKNIQIRKKS